MQSHAPETYKTKNPDTSVLKTAHFYQWIYSSLVKTAPLALVNKVPRVYILPFIVVFPEKGTQILQIS